MPHQGRLRGAEGEGAARRGSPGRRFLAKRPIRASAISAPSTAGWSAAAKHATMPHIAHRAHRPAREPDAPRSSPSTRSRAAPVAAKKSRGTKARQIGSIVEPAWTSEAGATAFERVALDHAPGGQRVAPQLDAPAGVGAGRVDGQDEAHQGLALLAVVSHALRGTRCAPPRRCPSGRPGRRPSSTSRPRASERLPDPSRPRAGRAPRWQRPRAPGWRSSWGTGPGDAPARRRRPMRARHSARARSPTGRHERCAEPAHRTRRWRRGRAPAGRSLGRTDRPTDARSENSNVSKSCPLSPRARMFRNRAGRAPSPSPTGRRRRRTRRGTGRRTSPRRSAPATGTAPAGRRRGRHPPTEAGRPPSPWSRTSRPRRRRHPRRRCSPRTARRSRRGCTRGSGSWRRSTGHSRRRGKAAPRGPYRKACRLSLWGWDCTDPPPRRPRPTARTGRRGTRRAVPRTIRPRSGASRTRSRRPRPRTPGRCASAPGGRLAGAAGSPRAVGTIRVDALAARARGVPDARRAEGRLAGAQAEPGRVGRRQHARRAGAAVGEGAAGDPRRIERDVGIGRLEFARQGLSRDALGRVFPASQDGIAQRLAAAHSRWAHVAHTA